jgi:hypothetical protein
MALWPRPWTAVLWEKEKENGTHSLGPYVDEVEPREPAEATNMPVENERGESFSVTNASSPRIVQVVWLLSCMAA